MNKAFDELKKSIAQSVSRRRALKTFGIGLAGMALARFGVNEAQAITNGTLDGNAHPNVGGFVWLKNIWSPDPPPVFIGTGTLIHPRAILTVGHGTHAIESAIAAGMMTIDDLRFSLASDASNPDTWRAVSSVVTHPGFADAVRGVEGDGAVPVPDVGVVILRAPVTGILPAPLPARGFLDALQGAGTLRQGAHAAKFTVVGYGSQLGDPVGQIPFPPDGLRRVVQSEFLNLNDRWLFLNQKFAQGLGGGSSGDSGAPTIWVDPQTGENTIVAVQAGGDARAVALGLAYRIDTAEALDFVNQVIAFVNNGQL